MKYFIGKKVYDFSNDELDRFYLDEGTEAICYRLGDFVLKIHHDYHVSDVLSEDNCKRLSRISTNRLLLPKDVVYDEDGNYLGYTIKYIKSEEPRIKNLKVGNLIDEFYILEKEVKQLDEEYVLLDDLNYLNTIFSNGFYLCDPGKYSFVDDFEKRRFLSYFNRETINYYEIKELIFRLFKFSNREKIRLLDTLFGYGEYVSEIIDDIGYNPEENAKTYFKRLANR